MRTVHIQPKILCPTLDHMRSILLPLGNTSLILQLIVSFSLKGLGHAVGVDDLPDCEAGLAETTP